MSTIQKITQLSHRIFNTSVTEQNVATTVEKNIPTISQKQEPLSQR